MKRCGAADLYNEVELIRMLMLDALGKMNRERKKLTFQDHLSALHAFSRASMRVAYLMKLQQEIFPPIEEVKGLVREMNNTMEETLQRLVERYEEKGEPLPDGLKEMHLDNLRRMIYGEIDG